MSNRKLLTAILLVAGTSIGGGTVALPMVLANLGVLPSAILMVMVWGLTYYMSLLSVELNLQLDYGLSLGKLGERFSGRGARLIGEISIKALSYALLAAYLSGSASILQQLISELGGPVISLQMLEAVVAVWSFLVLLGPVSVVSVANNVAFLGFLSILEILLVVFSFNMNVAALPWIVKPNLNGVGAALTVVFTSFGYQIIFHTLRNYLGANPGYQRCAFLCGSIIPAIVYLLWTAGVLGVLNQKAPLFFVQLVDGQVRIGELIGQLASLTRWTLVKPLVWTMSTLAVVTSIFGVGLGLTDTAQDALKEVIPTKPVWRRMIAALTAMLPAYLVAILAPGAFLRILSVAGAILVVIAIWLPAYLWWRAKFEKPKLLELKPLGVAIGVLVGLVMMIVGLLV